VHNTNINDAIVSLNGLSVGDAFGEQFFFRKQSDIELRLLPSGIWKWTDDTQMAISIVEVLNEYGEIVPDELIQRFVVGYIKDRTRNYGLGAAALLSRIFEGENWQQAAKALFDGGSYGNGGAMRAAPIGAFFKGDLNKVVEEARKSAIVTHAHPEGQAGAIATAVAACIAAMESPPTGVDFLKTVMQFIPDGETKDGISQALLIHQETPPTKVALLLGSGYKVSAQDTVPYCLWCAAYNLDDYQNALWQTVAGRGDMDTTCAIVGGIVVLSSRNIPLSWIEKREPLPKIIQENE